MCFKINYVDLCELLVVVILLYFIIWELVMTFVIKVKMVEIIVNLEKGELFWIIRIKEGLMRKLIES